MDEQKNEHGDQHDDGNRRDDPAEQVSRHRLSSSSFSREETSIPSLPALLLDDDLGAEDAAPRVGLILNALGFAIEHVVPPHEARRRRILYCLKRLIESLLALGRIERHALRGQRLVDLRTGNADPRRSAGLEILRQRDRWMDHRATAHVVERRLASLYVGP